MCGFVGFIDENDQTYDHRAVIVAMADAIAHRGPDSEGYFEDGRAALGFRRLAIIDLAGANQPLYNENRSLVLVFNGETAGGFRLARRSSIKDGLFDCIMLEKKNFLRSTLAMGRYLLRGNPKIVRHLQVRSLDIVSTVNEPTDVDGQKGAEFPLHIECIAGGLRIMCPRGE